MISPASPKPIHWVVKSRIMDGTVDRGILKYKSMMARMSVAYAELDPDVNITLLYQLRHQHHWNLYRSPDKYGLLNAEFPGIQLETHKPCASPHHSLICQQMAERVCD